MRKTCARVGAAVAALFVVALGTLSCGNNLTCSPEKAGFASSEQVTPRALPSRDAVPGNPCNPHVSVIRTEADLAQAYAAIALEEDAGDGGVAPPVVDFTRETVIVREATLDQGISWVAVRGTVVTLGLQGCYAPPDGCATTVIAVPAIVATFDTRSCDAVGCGFSGNN
jgi:hypothetical protein